MPSGNTALTYRDVSVWINFSFNVQSVFYRFTAAITFNLILIRHKITVESIEPQRV